MTTQHTPESQGLWRETEDAQRREVVITLGDVSLVISAPSRTALAHWSLAATERLNPGDFPALYAPGADADERLEVDDPAMIDRIEAVRARIERSRPHPGRLRWLLTGMVALAVLAGGVFWLPGALTRQTAALLPDAAREAIGSALLDEITHLSGQRCATPRGFAALDALSARLFPGDNPNRIAVLPGAVPDTLALPGGLIVVRATLVEDHDLPDVLAGYLLVEDLRRAAAPPLHGFLESAGLAATFRLLTTGRMPEAAIRRHALLLLARDPGPVAPAPIIRRFAEAEVSLQPYAFARDVSGETVLNLIEADPMRGRQGEPLLPDAAWISLQEICTPGA